MIKNILIPEKIGNYYIFAKRVVGFDIEKTHITATQVYLSGSKIRIERCIDQPLEVGNETSHDEKVVNAIKSILNILDPYDEIYTSISSSHVIFKSLLLPFIGHDKIKMVVNFEVEPLLPFSVNDALIDFIVTKEIKENNSSEVMVAAAQRKAVDDHIVLFEQAGVMPTKVVVDLLSLFSLYKNIPEYENLTGNIVLVDIGFNLTRIAYINNGRLAFVRTLSKGILSQAKVFAQSYGISQNDTAEMIMRYGYKKEDDQKYKEAIEKAASSFWLDIKFTLQSFSSQLGKDVGVSKVLILGQGAKIEGISSFAGNFLSLDCELFETESLSKKRNVTIRNALKIPSSNIVSLAVAFPSKIIGAFNLFKVGAGIKDAKLINKQLATAFIFILIIVVLLFVNSYMQVGRLKKEANASEKEVMSVLRKNFKIPSDVTALEDVIEEANSEVRKAEERFAFAGKDRFSCLKYLLALQDAIADKEGFGIVVESVTITEDRIILKAKVKDHEALIKLVKALKKSKLFSNVESPEKVDFEMNIDLAKNV